MKPVLLTIIDGFGLRDEVKGNAVLQANMPNYRKLVEEYGFSRLQASGEFVGLPSGQMGNSEVGHMNIGAGRIVYQPLEFITKSIREKTFYENEELLNVMNHVKENNSKLHIFGLLSDGGIHSHIKHIKAILEMAHINGVKEVYLHAFLDGRDTLSDIACTFLDDISNYMLELGTGKLADISGRYYSMDRERMWDLTKKYYDLLVNGEASVIDNYTSFIKESYSREIYDEFIEPVIMDVNSRLEENDGLIFANYRPDRATQTFTAITNNDFDQFPTTKFKNIKLVTMMPVEKTIKCTNAFSMPEVTNTLGMYLSDKKIKVLRIAEASKYPHVTYFFDGGLELDLPFTDKIIIPRKEVATYDMAPSMSAREITDKLVNVMDNYEVIILNFANCDMVGHTGNFKASIEALETVDECLGRLYKQVQDIGGLMLITADHGNIELMEDEAGNIITSHTTNPVPFIICDKEHKPKDGKLGDIAPTILKLMDIEIPIEMTGESLI